MSSSLTLDRLRPQKEYESPFDPRVPGYIHPHWWTDVDWALNDPGADFLVFSDNKGEVARALVLERPILARFAHFNSGLPTIEIDKFEVRRHLWGRDYGREAVALIRRRWYMYQVVAFSYNSDGFWRAIDFVETPRLDGETANSPLFVAPPFG